MAGNLLPRSATAADKLVSGRITGARYSERRELARNARSAIFRELLDAALKELRLVTNQYLTQQYWDQVESMADELEKRMLEARSILVEELLMEEFMAWKERSRRILEGTGYWWRP
jgi:hypothetical protein